MIEVGSLVTCEIDGHYNVTNNKSLCLVTGSSKGYIAMKVIAHAENKEYLGRSYTEYLENFKEITISEYFDKYPNAYKCPKFYKILKL